MGALRVSAVLFAKDFTKLSEFYWQVLELALTESRDNYTKLSAPGFDLVVHQIPKHIVDSKTLERPPRRREHAAIKLGFPVDSIERARAAAASLGGVLDPPASEWTDGGTTTCMGHDPEGNVFQVSTSARSGAGRRPAAGTKH